MERAMTGRRAALDGLARILDAGAPEELFTGPEREAHSLYGLLVDTARARASAPSGQIGRAARHPVVEGQPPPAAPEPPPPVAELAGASGLLTRVAALLAPVGADEIERLRAELAGAVADLERVRDQLRTLASLKHALEA